MSSFFIRKGNTDKAASKSGAGGRKRKGKLGKQSTSNSKAKKPKRNFEDEEISSDEFSDVHSENEVDEGEDVEDVETAQERKLRLAKSYLEEIEKEEKERLERQEIDNEVLASRLKDDVLAKAGKLRRKIGDLLETVIESDINVLRNKRHKLSVTCVVVSNDCKHVYSASKDANIIKWDIAKREKVHIIESSHNNKLKKGKSHSADILSLAISADNQFLASGDVKSVIHIWRPETMEHLHTFNYHSGAITGLAICQETNSLYSASADRSVKVFNLDEMMYVETLFGHQSSVTSIDVLCKDRTISTGGTDNSVRVWKIQEESQLIYNGSGRSIDVVKRLDDDHFVTGGEDGLVAVWGVLKKKPSHIISNSHEKDSSGEANWVTCVATLGTSDVFATGSSDGFIKVWKCEDRYRKSKLLFTVAVQGFINSMAFSTDDKYLVVGVGQEHKLGRWKRIKEARNSVLLIELKKRKEPLVAVNGES
ncbi:U3 small nucleolar RNA-interacting protein 2 [Nilaparvata lugens]|uniref:U3 small nucleolar RNA-interacting protein 2 n=1 Tax=Nilaparvata lugens TaxID=108931 RepID=UPI00193E74C4|nr:U3 small nucleolar RNA-interacting protein 2 [Nilaparvata lugens]